MKPSVLAAAALCAAAMACNRPEDTKSVDVWVRTSEARLSGTKEWQPCKRTPRPGGVLDDVRCGPKPPAAPYPVTAADECDDLIVNVHADAVRMLVTQPVCIDTAIAALKRFAVVDSGAMNDVAAAYLIRAQRPDRSADRAADILEAAAAADQAVLAAPQMAAARFNRALAQEALSLRTDAIASWDEFLKIPEPGWTGEAREHRDRLRRELLKNAAADWENVRSQLPAAVRTGDIAAVSRLIPMFPTSSQLYFEDVLLPQWAAAPNAENLTALRTFAGAWARRTGDRFDLDVVSSIAAAAPVQVAAIRDGIRLYGQGRGGTFGGHTSRAAYEKAVQSLEASPLRLLAQLRLSVVLSAQPDGVTAAKSSLASLLKEAAKRGYPHLWARIQSTQAYVLGGEGRYAESLDGYDSALARYQKLDDPEGLISTHTRRQEIIRNLGKRDESWSETFEAVRSIPNIIDTRTRQLLLMEASSTVLTLGHPQTALAYLNEAIRLINREPGKDRSTALGLALRARAGVELQLRHDTRARADLQEAIRLSKDEHDAILSAYLRARLNEVDGNALLTRDPLKAAEAYSRSLAVTPAATYPTYHAFLLTQRAHAYFLTGRQQYSERDLRSALQILRDEDERTLETRKRGNDEELWSSYFSRFQATYQQLIEQLAEQDRAQEAFAYAEQARAFEPLNLILQLDDLSDTFRSLAADGDTIDIDRIRALLPPDTYILQYSVHRDRTYTWILSRNGLKLLRQTARREEVERWTETIQRAVRRPSVERLNDSLVPPFDRLLKDPMIEVAAMAGNRTPRIVVIPDGAMHGMPIAALRNGEKGRYLVQDAIVSIAGSTKLYLYSLLRDQELPRSGAPSVLLIGNPAFDPSLQPELDELPYAVREVNTIARIYGSNVEKLLGEDATVPAFLARAPFSEIVHIAAHAIADAEVPSRSSLILARSPGERGDLNTIDILTRLQRLDQTRLVVLSACSTAGGAPVGAEGLAPLVRPLFAAGAPAVIGSLWDVRDATAEPLLVSFHRHYRRGDDAAMALRNAQVEMLNDNRAGLRSVLNWAPFQVIGHASSPYAGNAPTIKGGIPP